MMFIIKSAFKNILRNKFINLSILVSLSLGMLLPLMVLCIGNSFINSVKFQMPIHPQRTGAMVTDDVILDREKIKSDYIEMEEIVQSCFAEPGIIEFNGSVSEIIVSGSGPGDSRISYNNIYIGRYMTDEEAESTEKICVITIALYRELGCVVGDYINLNGTEYRVIGVLNSSSGDDYIILPINTFAEIYVPRYSYMLLLKDGYDFKTLGTKIFDGIKSEYGLINETYPIVAGEFFEEDLSNIIMGISIMMSIASVLLLYAVLNIINILGNKINKDKPNYIIRTYLGVKKSANYLYLFSQIFILTVTASLIDIGVMAVLKIFVPLIGGFMYELDMFIVLIFVLFGFVLSFFLSVFLLAKHLNIGKGK